MNALYKVLDNLGLTLHSVACCPLPLKGAHIIG